ncbi:MAG: hypothetical protein ACFFCZ_18190 [Promethearchaeota archaeon]
MKQYFLAIGVTLLVVGAIVFFLNPPSFNVAVVETEFETWYDSVDPILATGFTTRTRWIKADEIVHIFVNVTEPTAESIRVEVIDESGTAIINQTTGMLNTSWVVQFQLSQYYTVDLDNTYDLVNDKSVALTLTIEREVVVMREVPSSLPLTGFVIFVLGAGLFIIGCFLNESTQGGKPE